MGSRGKPRHDHHVVSARESGGTDASAPLSAFVFVAPRDQSVYTGAMPATGRSHPARGAFVASDYSLAQFIARYPDDGACLDRLWRSRYAPDGHHAHCSNCARERKVHRTKTRTSYTCDSCGSHVHPMKGTIFERSTTSLELWFYAIYLMSSTRCGISAKQLERELGVSYRTARRMMNKIRTELMNDCYDSAG
jgi:transposase-like protein